MHDEHTAERTGCARARRTRVGDALRHACSAEHRPHMPSKKSPATQALGEAMRSGRRERGVGQERFAAHAGLDRSYCGAVERGEFQHHTRHPLEDHGCPRHARKHASSPSATLTLHSPQRT